MSKQETESINENLVKVANCDEIPVGKMKHVEVDGKEILIVNVNGKYYAISDRCGHMNTLLSLGSLNGTTIISSCNNYDVYYTLNFSNSAILDFKNTSAPLNPSTCDFGSLYSFRAPPVIMTIESASTASIFPASCPSLDLTFLWTILSQSKTGESSSGI